MIARIPGSLWGRALRSRLVVAQQQRFARTPQSLTARSLPSLARAYSTAPDPAEQPAAAADHEEPEQQPAAPTSMPQQPARFANRSGRLSFLDTRNLGEKAEGDLLMAIASRLSPDVDAPGDSILPSGLSRKVLASQLDRSRKGINIELKWLKDPRELADRVGRVLQLGDPALAVALIRGAQKNKMKCDVAWNHLLAYCMDRNQPRVAFKFYNDMKKRGRKPKETTYTIMLRGFSRASKSKEVVKTAYSVYRSISAPNSAVKRSTIHTNAMLTVCHRHEDMNMLWRIAGDLPEEGPGAPDMATYTIILTALQFAAARDVKALGPDQIDKILERKAQAVREGKRVWADIVYRWTHEHLTLDNKVVHAMATLLLEGASDRDCYDVLTLYNQTMGIPILQEKPPPIPSSFKARVNSGRIMQDTSSAPPPPPKRQPVEDVPFVDDDNQLLELAKAEEDGVEPAVDEQQPEEEMEEEEEESFEDLFDPVVPQEADLSYLQPDNKDLTVILDACFTMTQGTAAGMAYWRHLTLGETDHHVAPDPVSFLQYLRLLRISRSSFAAVKVMRDQMVASKQANGKAFHVALSSCRRDRRNPSVLLYANELLSLMHQSLILPDPRALEGYLELIQILSNNPESLLAMNGLGADEGLEARSLQNLGKKLQVKLRLVALATLRPHINQLHEAMEYGKPSPKGRWSALHQPEIVFGMVAAKVMARARMLIDDTLKIEYMLFVPKSDRKTLESESRMLRKYSDKETVAKFRSQNIFPTIEQKNRFLQRS
ncbi:hypothetical protein NUU61_009958 [Penicillium alfredii]|uniref:Pentatricopeptide repeat protein n=1 Tax=Penicillium alfredii TaxID=1506179 RepID=A0A9W9EH37_9EURO|nr:uncharacterized protein NUU61_009958 [Penicillium alfredii]KAJ5081694.1 hypothetical protein NUU61_009958 [Penicillium alfredii]